MWTDVEQEAFGASFLSRYEPPRTRPCAHGIRTRSLRILATLTALSPLAAAQAPLLDPLPDIPFATTTLRLEALVSTLEFPVDVADPDDGTGRLFVNSFDGRTHVLQASVVLPTPFVDLRQSPPFMTNSSAMSSIVFHPDFAVDEAAGIGGRIYVVMIEAPGTGAADFGIASGEVQQSVLYELRPDPSNPDREDPGARREILRINEASVLHNLNDLAFGPDGYLYATKGDDLTGGQDTTTIHGTVLRIDVDGLAGNPPSANGAYWIPADNPYLGDPTGLDEIWAFGFRNPWRASFDTATGELYVAENGERDIEEIDLVQLSPTGSAQNYGWNEMEGSFRHLGNGVTDDLTGLPPGFVGVDPVGEYDHTEDFTSVIGGVVYRGSALTGLEGRYLFADWIGGLLFQLDPATGEILRFPIDAGGASVHGQAPFAPGPPQEGMVAVRQDAQGELLVVVTQRNATATGRLLRVHIGEIGARYCDPAAPNSTGLPGIVRVGGSLEVIHDAVALTALQLPPTFGYFLASRTQGAFAPPGSSGVLCLAADIGRFNQPGSIGQGPSFEIRLDLSSIPVNPPTAVLPGDTWNFQCWYRDVGNTNNFTDAVRVTFR